MQASLEGRLLDEVEFWREFIEKYASTLGDYGLARARQALQRAEAKLLLHRATARLAPRPLDPTH